MTVWDVLAGVGKEEERNRLLRSMWDAGYSSEDIAAILGADPEDVKKAIKRVMG